MNILSILLTGMDQHVAVQTLTTDNATGLGTKLTSGFAPQGVTPVARRPTSRSLKDYLSHSTPASVFLPCQRRTNPAGEEAHLVIGKMSSRQQVLLRWHAETPYSHRVGHDHRRRRPPIRGLPAASACSA